MLKIGRLFRPAQISAGITVLAILRALKDILGGTWEYFAALNWLIGQYGLVRDFIVGALASPLPPPEFSEIQKDLIVIILSSSGVLASSKLRIDAKEEKLLSSIEPGAMRNTWPVRTALWFGFYFGFAFAIACMAWHPVFYGTAWMPGFLVLSAIGWTVLYVSLIFLTGMRLLQKQHGKRFHFWQHLLTWSLAVLVIMITVLAARTVFFGGVALATDPSFVSASACLFFVSGLVIFARLMTGLFSRSGRYAGAHTARGATRRRWYVQAIFLTIVDLALATAYVAIIAVVSFEIWKLFSGAAVN